MTDKELLDLAAKAVGLTPAADSDQEWVDDGQGGVTGPFEWKDAEGGELLYHWNPLTDDGDALRLSVALLMELDHNHPADPRPWVSVGIPGTRHCVVEDFDDECQRLAATRTAITSVAAAIGEQMP